MAYATDNSNALLGTFGARFATLTADIRARMARRKVYRDTFRELASLSDRELADLGLNRSMLRRVAYQAAYEV